MPPPAPAEEARISGLTIVLLVVAWFAVAVLLGLVIGAVLRKVSRQDAEAAARRDRRDKIRRAG
jgi:hypothetical protein